VSGVVPALEAHDHVGLLRQDVYYLALTLVAPLDSYQYARRHFALPEIDEFEIQDGRLETQAGISARKDDDNTLETPLFQPFAAKMPP
jgi:hypothetical protein